MKLVRPFTIAPGNLTSNIAQDDAPEYSASATYAVGDVVMSTTGAAPTYRKYESLAAGNVGNALDDASKWLDLGPVNRWAMFDTKNGTATTSASNIAVSVAIDGRADGLALFGLDAERVYAQLTYTGNQHANFLTYSETFNNVAWAKVSVSLTGSELAPDGTTNGIYLNEGTALASHSLRQSISLTPDATYTFSIYAKAGSCSVIQLVLDHVSGANDWANFDLINGTITAGPLSATIEDAGNGWYRCSVTGVCGTAAATNLFVFTCDSATATRVPTYSGTGREVALWGAQIEQSAFATSYIQTTSAAVTTTTHTPWRSLVNLQSDSGVTSWYDYFTEEIAYKTEAVLTGLPLYANPTISVTISAADGVVSCGTMVVGQSRELGGAVYGAKGGIQDYSRKETDDFGNYTLVERSYAKRNTFRVVCENNAVDAIFNLLAEVRATPVVWLGTDDYALTWSYGWARDWAVEIAYPTKSFLTIEIEGLT